jgi:hypothetical protein
MEVHRLENRVQVLRRTGIKASSVKLTARPTARMPAQLVTTTRFVDIKE